jgi:hypothetical protein
VLSVKTGFWQKFLAAIEKWRPKIFPQGYRVKQLTFGENWQKSLLLLSS